MLTEAAQPPRSSTHSSRRKPQQHANAAQDLKALDKNLAEADVKEGLLFSPRKSGEAL